MHWNLVEVYFRFVHPVDGKVSSVRIDAMRLHMQVVVLAPLMLMERWATTAASLPILLDALVNRRVDSMMVALAALEMLGMYPSIDD